MKNSIFLMTKTPIHGLVKTRLAKIIGNSSAKKFTLKNINNVSKILINKKNFNFFIYSTPKKKFRSFSFNFSKNILTQKGKDLGKKIWYLNSIIKYNFVIIGSDIPDINFKHLSYAFELLRSNDVVIGPSFDKGFWLIGFAKKKAINYPFKELRWGTKHVLKDLINNLKKSNLKISFCEKLRDIDIFDDYCDYKDRFKNH
tara:strand:- start:182 stop:781 length:600 start_codon:yes stop_codon:yes gene_type:complete